MEQQISAIVSGETKAQLDRYVREAGKKKGVVIEQALRHHLLALQELPPDAIVPARIVLTTQDFETVATKASSRKRPTKALRDLMNP